MIFLIFSNSKEELRENFKIKDLGSINYFLGIQVKRDREKREIGINQSQYMENILEKFNVVNAKGVKTPMLTVSNGSKTAIRQVNRMLRTTQFLISRQQGHFCIYPFRLGGT